MPGVDLILILYSLLRAYVPAVNTGLRFTQKWKCIQLHGIFMLKKLNLTRIHKEMSSVRVVVSSKIDA